MPSSVTMRLGTGLPALMSLTALKLGAPGAAALDVFPSEPLPQDDVLLRMPNVLATPHLGYVEKDSYELYFQHAFQNLVDFASGTCKTILNPNYAAHPRFRKARDLRRQAGGLGLAALMSQAR
eukprot:gene27728-34494_t